MRNRLSRRSWVGQFKKHILSLNSNLHFGTRYFTHKTLLLINAKTIQINRHKQFLNTVLILFCYYLMKGFLKKYTLNRLSKVLINNGKTCELPSYLSHFVSAYILIYTI